MHWTVTYDEGHEILDHVGPNNLLRIRRSDGLWMLSGKAKDRPGPYGFLVGDRKLQNVKEWASGYEYGDAYDD